MKIGIIGDFIKDIYVYCECSRISPELPIPVFEEKETKVFPGGSGNVARNILSFGAQIQHYWSEEQASKKTRYVVDNRIVFRVDNDVFLNNDTTDFHFDDDVKYVVISDYSKGFINNPSKVIENLNKKGKKIIVDIKKHISNYSGAFVAKMNANELKKFGDSGDYQEIREKYNIENLIVTLGKDGCIVSNDTGNYVIETDSHQVSDVTGAGDVFIAALAYYITKGDDILTASRYATKLASISVTKFGTYVLTKEDIDTVTKKEKIVFTNGCFDILHAGHINYLKSSKKLGTRLIVGLNSDSSVRRLKGKHRPINNQEVRKLILENLKFVDEVIIFDEDTPKDLIMRIKPDIITKGGDYKKEDVVGADLVKDVVILPYEDNFSTTKILEKMNEIIR